MATPPRVALKWLGQSEKAIVEADAHSSADDSDGRSSSPRPGKKEKRPRRSKSVGGEGALGSDLYVPGEVTREPLDFTRPTKVYVSANNPGAPKLAAEMATRYPQLQIASPSEFKSMPRPQSFGASVFGSPDYFLLGLNKSTFLNEEGSKLAAEVEQAKAMGLRIALAHETDDERDGCEFGRFFQTVRPWPPAPREPRATRADA